MISDLIVAARVGDWVIIGVPLYTLADYRGMGDSPAALRKAGLAEAVGAGTDMGDVEIPMLRRDVLEGRVKNMTHFKDASTRIFNVASSSEAEQAVVLGGECSETVGALAGLTRRYKGKAGMLWLDAHGDFNTPSTSPSGYIGGMCLALACGKAHGLDLGIGQSTPPLADERLVHMGSRDLDQPEIAAFNESPAKLYTAQQVKKSGSAEVAEEAARHLDNRSDWIACHLDVDVVDPELIPAVNCPTPGGLTFEETSTIVRELAATQKLRALEVAAYNPTKDRGGASAKRIVELLRTTQS